MTLQCARILLYTENVQQYIYFCLSLLGFKQCLPYYFLKFFQFHFQFLVEFHQNLCKAKNC